ncbi:MAG: RIP metalloprotease RseP [Desulfovibrionaceae bacterium]
MVSFIAIVLVLGGLIFFHELGHFLVARGLGVGVRTFSLGFGPKLLAFRGKRTEYRLSAIPLGGYVNLVGEQFPDEGGELDPEFSEREHFMLRPPWQRMLVVAAGPLFNFLLAWLLFWILLGAQGKMILPPVVGDLQPDGPAAEAGLAPGDHILTVGGQPVESWKDMAETIQQHGALPLSLTLKRDGQTLRKTLRPEIQEDVNVFGETVQRTRIGVIAAMDRTSRVPVDWLPAFAEAGKETWRMTVFLVEGVIKIIERIVPLEKIGGPITIAQMVSSQAKKGIYDLLFITAIISINLGLINLLPIPVLDGGHLIFFAMEIVLRRPVNERVRRLATQVGLLAILALMGLAIYNDLARNFADAPL